MTANELSPFDMLTFRGMTFDVIEVVHNTDGFVTLEIESVWDLHRETVSVPGTSPVQTLAKV